MSLGEFNELRIEALLKNLDEIKKDLAEIERLTKQLTEDYINFEGEYIPDEDNELLQSIIKLRKKVTDE